MKKLFIVAVLFLTYTCAFSQKEANFWYFGNNAGIDFSSGTPTVLTNGKLKTDEGCSSISDKDGNLLFYSDGISVWTKNHELMKYSNGSLANNLEGNPSSTQSGLIVPKPKDPNIYYIFTVGTNYVGTSGTLPVNPGFNYYTVDISKGNGGEIINGPVNLSDGKDLAWSEKVTAVQGKNCNEIWALSIVRGTFYAYKISENGVDTTPVLSSVFYTLRDKRGYLKVSPDGTKIALADYAAGTNSANKFVLGSSQLMLFNFNANTGKISGGTSLLNIQTDGAPYGVEFSQQSSKLYTSTHDGLNNKVFQFDLTAKNIAESKYLINQRVGYRGALQLAPNAKIYATVPESYFVGGNFLDVIENPDDEATKVSYSQNAVNLNGKTNTQGLPPFIQSFFAPVNIVFSKTNEILDQTNQILCNQQSYTIQPQQSEANATYTWFKDEKEIAKTKDLTISEKNFGSGLYEVKIKSLSNCKKTYTGKVTISFKPKPTINKIPPYVQCDFDENPIDGFTNFNLSSKEQELVSDLTDITIEFFEITDTDFKNPLNKTIYKNKSAKNQSVVVRATNNKTKCYDTQVLDLQVKPSGLTSYKDEYSCELDKNSSATSAKFSESTNTTIYDFSNKTKQIISESNGVLSESTHIFQYYKTPEDASLQNNEIKPPYKNHLFTNNSVVYVRISNKGANACEAIGSFKIFINKMPIPLGNPNEMILCVSNPILNPQPNTIELNANTGTDTDTYKWYLNGIVIPNVTSAIHKANKAGEYKVEAYRNYPNSANICMGYNSFYVKESNKALVVNTTSEDDPNNPEKKSITITINGIGNYQYALNSTDISDFRKGTENLSFTFTNVSPGANNVYIRDENGCGISKPKKISTIYFQKHFSPNGDGHLDTWKVLGLSESNYKVVKINIFNRFGKLLKQINNKTNVGWSGIYNGKLLPSNDYWYNVELVDEKGKVFTKTGHFSLLRK